MGIKRIFTIVLILAIIFSGINILINYPEVSGSIIYVGSSSKYTTIQSAIDAAKPGDTIIVENGTFHESVRVYKANIKLIGNSTTDCKIVHNYSGSNFFNDYAAAINITTTGVNISGFNISVSGNYTYGIRFNSSIFFQATIENNNIATNGSAAHGICINQSSNNFVLFNNITLIQRDAQGIYLFRSINNNINNNSINTINQNSHGIRLDYTSSRNIIHYNLINTYESYSIGISLYESSNNNRIMNNNIETAERESFGINLSSSSFNRITNNKINTSGWFGYNIYLTSSSNNNIISENKLKSYGVSGYGIHIFGNSNNNEVTRNTYSSYTSSGYGIQISDNSNNNDVFGNVINTYQLYGVGIIVTNNANNNDVMENKINTYGMMAHGIISGESRGNNLSKNEINTNGRFSTGITVSANNYVSRNNIILNNTITTSNSGAPGISVYKSIENYFFNNTITTFDSGAYGLRLGNGANNNKFQNIFITTYSSSGYGIIIENTGGTWLSNCKITTSSPSAYGIFLNNRYATIVDSIFSTNSNDMYVNNNGNLTAINCNFSSVEVTNIGGGVLQVKNYLDIQVYDEDGVTYLPEADVEVLDNVTKVYSSSGYGGSDPRTDTNGRIKRIIVTDRWYIRNNTATENITTVKVKKIPGLYWEEIRDDVNMNISHTEVFIANATLPPAIPTGLKVTRFPGNNSLNITWDLNLDTFFYEVYTNQSGTWELMDNVSHPQNWTLLKDLQDEMWYYFKIQALGNFSLASGFSPVVSYYLKDITPPAIPTGLMAAPIAGDDAINITWNLSSDDTVKYDVWVAGPTGSWVQLINISQGINWYVWSDESLVNGIEFNFRIRAWDKVGLFSEFSAPVSVLHRDYLAPSVPRNLKAITLSETEIELNWNASIDSDVEGYKIFINKSGSGSGGPYRLLEIIENLNFSISGLLNNTPYYFVVAAFDEANNTSPFSNEAWNSTLPVIIVYRPEVVNTIPVNNSVDIAIDSPVTIVFSIPMNITSIEENITIQPTIRYSLSWNANNTGLRIEFPDNLGYEIEYAITIDTARGSTGGILRDTPFVLTFTTEINPNPPTPEINITYPDVDTIIQPSETINITGMSSDLAEDTQINVTFGNNTATGVVDKNGSWYVLITAPETEGYYIITAMVGDLNYSLSVNVIDSTGDGDGGGDGDGDGDGDDDRDDFLNIWDMGDNGFLFMGIFILILVIIIVLIGITLFLRKRKRARASEEGYWGDEYYDEYYDEYGYEEYTGVERRKKKHRRGYEEEYDEEYTEDYDEEYEDEYEEEDEEEYSEDYDKELEPELESETEEYEEEEIWDEEELEEIDKEEELEEEEIWDEEELEELEEIEDEEEWNEE